MCLPQTDENLYFYYVSEKCKRISETWNTYEYVFFSLIISLIVFIWCDIVNEENKQCCRPCATPCIRNRASCSNSNACKPKRRVSICEPRTAERSPPPPLRRSLRLCNKALSQLCKVSNSPINNFNSPQRCCCPAKARSPRPPVRRSIRLHRSGFECFESRPNECSSSAVSIHSTQLMYCGEWCKRREEARCREEARKRSKSRSRSRSKR